MVIVAPLSRDALPAYCLGDWRRSGRAVGGRHRRHATPQSSADLTDRALREPARTRAGVVRGSRRSAYEIRA